ncbi:pancreatic triacylglycerol lipase-like [Penaeus monodon]|uniref:pancreatic triacylglycerol lipase-like n=1 Tax=Penaeus monodon TaxID=6687 RepID=UPI0018A7B40E|nr:pancreatic triacylglycerol lipase-like [Penaeus monodon]
MEATVRMRLLLVVGTMGVGASSFLLQMQYCFGEIGCFATNTDFYHPLRPTNPTPISREDLDLTYHVWSREDQLGTMVRAARIADILNTTLKASRKTKVLIHGYLDSEGATWVYDMAAALLLYGDFNVLTVDWGGGSRALYDQAAVNARVAGLEVAFLLNWLEAKLDHHPRDVHLIGHSLGATFAGYAGERVIGLGRITGLDPAGPYFENLPPKVRLDPTDALFVDVIHTNGDPLILQGLGMKQACGHLDFYPNGGRQQPGCNVPLRASFDVLNQGIDINHGFTLEQKVALTCSHSRSTQLFISSLISGCEFQAYYCLSHLLYRTGLCQICGDGSWCARMGIEAEKWRGLGQAGRRLEQMYVTTTDEYPYC